MLKKILDYFCGSGPGPLITKKNYKAKMDYFYTYFHYLTTSLMQGNNASTKKISMLNKCMKINMSE